MPDLIKRMLPHLKSFGLNKLAKTVSKIEKPGRLQACASLEALVLAEVWRLEAS